MASRRSRTFLVTSRRGRPHGWPADRLLDSLESRCLLSTTYWVSPTGSDSNTGTQASPYRTIQAVVAQLQPGDTLNVMPGTYAGFVVGWDDPGQGIYGAINGTAQAPITIQAAPGSPAGSVIISSRNNKTADGIDLESSSYLIVQGFTVNNASGSITRAGIRSVINTNVTIRNNTCDHCGTWGILTGFSQNVDIENNVASNSQAQHGIYVGNSADNPIIRNNILFGNSGCGIHINADASQGGDGIITNALVEGNIIYNNGVTGGSAINMDGVQNSLVRNNLLYGNHASGISLYQIDGAQPAKNDTIINNTIVMASDARWALNIVDGSTGAVVFNNILLNNSSHGAINIDTASRTGFFSDYNIVKDLFSPDDGDTFQNLAQWRTTTGQDAHSVTSTAASLFANAGVNDYHLLADSPARDSGTGSFHNKPAPATDLEGNARPGNGLWDIGAYELQTVDATSPVVSNVAALNLTPSGATISWSTNEAADSQVQYGPDSFYGTTTTLQSAFMTGHSVAISGLQAGTTYHFSVLSRDGSGNLTTSGDFTFTTPTPPPPADTTVPTAAVLASAVTTAGGKFYTFTVTYTDDVALNVATLGSTNIQVKGKNGFSQLAKLVSVDLSTNGPVRTATYQIKAPGGAWKFGNNGTYTIWMRPKKVADTAGNFVIAGQIGSFVVNVPRKP